MLTEKAASEIIESQIAGIRERFASVSEEASLSAIDQSVLWGRVFLNPYVFEGAPARLTALERRT